MAFFQFLRKSSRSLWRSHILWRSHVLWRGGGTGDILFGNRQHGQSAQSFINKSVP